MVIKGPFCPLSGPFCPGPNVFGLFTPDMQSESGKITAKYTGYVSDKYTDAKSFRIKCKSSSLDYNIDFFQ